MAKTDKDRTRPRRGGDSNREKSPLDFGFSLGGFLEKFGGVMEKLADMAQTGQSLSETGELKGLDPDGKLRGVYGFSIKTGIGDQGEREVKVEPFGNIRRESSGDTVIESVREPLVDVYEEEDHVLVLAEIPGVSKKDVQLELCDECLTIRAQRGDKRYHKEVTLPARFSPEHMQWECTNGILKIRLKH
jgi:HSP20 family protein